MVHISQLVLQFFIFYYVHGIFDAEKGVISDTQLISPSLPIQSGDLELSLAPWWMKSSTGEMHKGLDQTNLDAEKVSSEYISHARKRPQRSLESNGQDSGYDHMRVTSPRNFKADVKVLHDSVRCRKRIREMTEDGSLTTGLPRVSTKVK